MGQQLPLRLGHGAADRSGVGGTVRRGEPGELIDCKQPGSLWRPTPTVRRWRLIDLSQWISEKFQVSIWQQRLTRELRAMDYRKLSAWSRHHACAKELSLF
jgi:hypothetical protein